jgi:hypothetical protein
MGIVRFALRWPYTFYVLALLILFLGVTAFRSMPTDIFPEIDIPVVTVIWQYTGLSTPEMEQRVTTYSEYAMSTAVSGIKDIEAQTLDGISVQKIYFQPDVSIDLAIAQIINADQLHPRAAASRHPGAARRPIQCLQRQTRGMRISIPRVKNSRLWNCLAIMRSWQPIRPAEHEGPPAAWSPTER